MDTYFGHEWFDAWLAERIAEQTRWAIEALVEQGWTEEDASAFVARNPPREGGEP